MTTNHDALREALELGLDYAREALALHDQKYQRHPSTEAERALIAGHVEQIEQTLAASKPEQAQGEPEVVATVSSRWSNGRGFDVDDFGKNLPNYGDELITLQSHREAIAQYAKRNVVITQMLEREQEALAQHRAALEECVEMLDKMRVRYSDAIYDGAGAEKAEKFECDIAAISTAITHANQVLDRKEGE